MELEAARNLAETLMRKHGLPRAWSFGFDRSKVRFGKCDYRRKLISLSSHLVALNDPPNVEETILHEIAHVLAPPRAGHGPEWQAIARSIGCNGQRCYGDEVRRPTPKYRGTCRACGRVIRRHRRTVIACGRCTRVFDPRFAFVWTDGK